MSERSKILNETINSTSSPCYGRGWNVIYYWLREHHPTHNFSQPEVIRAVQKSLVHQRYRQNKAPKVVNKFTIARPNTVIQIDETMFVQDFVLLIAIDAASRVMYGCAHKRHHTKADVIELIKKINTLTKSTPSIISDNGQIFQWEADELPNKHINTTAYTSTANARAERANRMVKEILSKHLAAGVKMSDELLQKVLKSFNETYHSVIRAKPTDVSTKTKIDSFDTNGKISNAKPNLDIGDSVRISLLRENLALRKDVTYKASHVPKWSTEIYKIVAVHIPRTPTKGLYYLLEGKADTHYYEHDLQLVNPNVRRPIHKKPVKLVEPVKELSQTRKTEERDLKVVTVKLQPIAEKRKRVPNRKYQ